MKNKLITIIEERYLDFWLDAGAEPASSTKDNNTKEEKKL